MDAWWEALNFFFGRAFYQGRRDDISARVQEAANDILQPRLSQTDGLVTDVQLKTIEQELCTRIGKGKIGKFGDVKMIISTLRYLQHLPGSEHSGSFSGSYQGWQDRVAFPRSANLIYARDGNLSNWP